MPLFGANKRKAEANGGEGADAQRRRMQEHWASIRIEEELDRRREVVSTPAASTIMISQQKNMISQQKNHHFSTEESSCQST